MAEHKGRKATIIFTAVFAGLVIGGYFAYKHFSLTKKVKVDFLIQNEYYRGGTNGAHDLLMKLDDDYINNWYKAAKNKADTFTSNGKTFITKGGWSSND